MSYTLFNCSITNIRINIGFDSTESRMDVGLVPDPALNQFFNPVPIGSPVYFNIGALSFNGILESYKARGGSDGQPLYDASIVDPRGIFSGVQLILNDFIYPTSNVPNVINIYGYLVSKLGFGGVDINDTGILYSQVRAALIDLINGAAPDYGGAISLFNSQFTLDLDELPLLSPDYRLSSVTSMSLEEMLTEVLDAACANYFITMSNTNAITVQVRSRKQQPSIGQIAQFVASVSGVSSRDVGVNLVNDVTSKMIIGAKKRDFYFANNNYRLSDITDMLLEKDYAQILKKEWSSFPEKKSEITNPPIIIGKKIEPSKVDNRKSDLLALKNAANILPFWGYDKFGKPIISTGIGGNELMYLDSDRLLVEGVGTKYGITVLEMRAALAGKDSWQSYMHVVGNLPELPNRYGYIINNGTYLIDESQPNPYSIITTTKDGDEEVKKGSPLIPNIANGAKFGKKFVDFIADKDDIEGLNKVKENLIDSLVPGKKAESEEADVLWNAVLQFANTYYGKQYMIKIPGLKRSATSTLDDSGNPVYRYNFQGTDFGYINSDTIEKLLRENKLPQLYGLMENQQGLISAYCRYDDAWKYDFSDIPDDKLYVGSDVFNINGEEKPKEDKKFKQSVFIQCEIDPTPVFIGEVAYVVMILPGRVIANKESTRWTDELFYIFYSARTGTIPLAFVDGQLQPESEENLLARDPIYDALRKDTAGQAYDPEMPLAVPPDFVAVPLESNIDRYGPWVSIGAVGKTELVTDETLAPWTYGSPQIMNRVGQALVNDSVSQQTLTESGTIEVPGLPTLGIERLNGIGPYVTNIDISFSNGGLITTYSFGSWQPKYSKTTEQNIQKIQRLALANIRIKKETRLNGIYAKIGNK